MNEIYTLVGRDKMTLLAISHQLKQLADLEIVEYKKQGKEKWFKLSNRYCWCILRDAFEQFGNKINIRCEKCEGK